MMDIDLLLDSATPAETTVSLCLNGKLRAEYETLKARIDARAEEADTDPEDTRLASGRRKPDPEQKTLDALAEKMREYTLTFRLVALPRTEFAKLLADCPPRTDPKTGRPTERFNADKMFPLMLRKAIAEPSLSADQYDKLLSRINEAQFDKLATAAWNLNHEDADLPF